MAEHDLIERKQYMQRLLDLKDHNIINVISGVRCCGKSTLLMMFADELLQFSEFYNYSILKSPILSKDGILANFIH